MGRREKFKEKLWAHGRGSYIEGTGVGGLGYRGIPKYWDGEGGAGGLQGLG